MTSSDFRAVQGAPGRRQKEATAAYTNPHARQHTVRQQNVIYEYGQLIPDASVDKNALTGYIYA